VVTQHEGAATSHGAPSTPRRAVVPKGEK
jgi:hypothetical protein